MTTQEHLDRGRQLWDLSEAAADHAGALAALFGWAGDLSDSEGDRVDRAATALAKAANLVKEAEGLLYRAGVEAKALGGHQTYVHITSDDA